MEKPSSGTLESLGAIKPNGLNRIAKFKTQMNVIKDIKETQLSTEQMLPLKRN